MQVINCENKEPHEKSDEEIARERIILAVKSLTGKLMWEKQS